MALLTPEQETAILESVARGTPPRQAFLANGVNDNTLRRWQQIAEGATHWPGTSSPVDPDTRTAIAGFVDRLTQAQASTFQVLTNALYRNATTVNPKSGHTDTQAADKLLSKHPAYRREWFEYREQHTTSDNRTLVEHQWADQLEAAGGPEALRQAREALRALPDAQG